MKRSLQLVVNVLCETVLQKHIICHNILHLLTLYVLVALMMQINMFRWESYLHSGVFFNGVGDLVEVGKTFFTIIFSR